MKRAAFFRASVFLAAVNGGVSAGWISQTAAQETGEPRLALEEVIVTARRKEELLQDVPISMTVFNQQQISDLNMVGTADLATFTPSMTANTRFGPDNSSFSIRGFVQELRTTSTVGVYFADVVAPRGGPSVQSADGAGPGYLYDLQSVQVLKGPQGTLFGRNTTGGAVMIVPNKPGEQLEGYGEVSAGNYDMYRTQGVVNWPINDRVRVRAGFDQMEQNGYLKNAAPVGPDRQGDIDYIAGRVSVVADITEDLENYTVFSITDSKNKATTAVLMGCFPQREGEVPPGAGVGIFSPFCQAQQAEYGLDSSSDFYTYASRQPQTVNRIEQKQVINTTNWAVTENLGVKNILSYAENETTLRTGVFGTDWIAADGNRLWFTESDVPPGYPTAHMSTTVWELQVQGENGPLDWQAGWYYEQSRPEEDSANELNRYGICAENPGLDPDAFRCQASFALENVGLAFGNLKFDNRALYAQSTYNFDAPFSLTAGIRYTWDKTWGYSDDVQYGGFPVSEPGPPTTVRCSDGSLTYPDCRQEFRQDSDKPTWMFGLDYTPHNDQLYYAKYSRGYRQGSVNIFGAPGFQTHEPETVDAYEIGSKLTLTGTVPGIVNIAVFYNELTDMQIQTGFRGAVNTSGITNAGQATIWGAEVETSLSLTEQLRLDVAYAYLNTRLDSYEVPAPIPEFDVSVVPTAVEGDPLPLTPKNTVVTSLTYLLPVPEAVGQVSIGATYVYTDQMLASTTSPFGTIPDSKLTNFNVNWNGIGGSRVDALVFVTNAFDEEHISYVIGLYDAIGSEFYNPGMPRMYGVRLRYNF